MRWSASLAIGALPSLAMSKNLRRRCAQQKASVSLAGCCGGNGLVGGVSVALHDAAVGVEQLQGVNRTATRSIGEGNGGRIGSAPGPVVTGNRPEVPLLGAAAAGIEHRHHGLIDCDLGRGQNELAQPEIN